MTRLDDIRLTVLAVGAAAAIVFLLRDVAHEVFRMFLPLARPWLLDVTLVVLLAVPIRRSFPEGGRDG